MIKSKKSFKMNSLKLLKKLLVGTLLLGPSLGIAIEVGISMVKSGLQNILGWVSNE